jgi:hypothetical protein
VPGLGPGSSGQVPPHSYRRISPLACQRALCGCGRRGCQRTALPQMRRAHCAVRPRPLECGAAAAGVEATVSPPRPGLSTPAGTGGPGFIPHRDSMRRRPALTPGPEGSAPARSRAQGKGEISCSRRHKERAQHGQLPEPQRRGRSAAMIELDDSDSRDRSPKVAYGAAPGAAKSAGDLLCDSGFPQS